MNELSYQKLLIKVVKDHGGFAYKSGSKFLIGVSDIFFSFPWIISTVPGRSRDHNAGFLEAKLNPIPVRSSTLIRLDTTVKQQEFLRNVEKGGARAGVISFIRNSVHVGACIVRPEQTELTITMYSTTIHRQREDLVWRVLERWLNNA